MRINEAQEILLDDILVKYPRGPIRGLRKLEPELAVRTTYQMDPNDSEYDVEIWYVDHTNGARWVEAPKSSGIHRRGIGLIKTMLRINQLQDLVDDGAAEP